MHLVSCPIPQEPLEDAPRSALLTDDAQGATWDGFWSADCYFARRTAADGSIEWFQLADDAAAANKEPRVLTLRAPSRIQSRVSVVVAQSPNGQHMLVGGSVRRIAR